MNDTTEPKIISYAVVRPSGYYYPAAIIAVDKTSDKMITGTYAYGQLLSGQGAIVVADTEYRWKRRPAGAEAKPSHYRVPKGQILAEYRTLKAALAAYELGDAVPTPDAFIDRPAINDLDTRIAAARCEEAAARDLAENLWRDRTKLLAEAAQAQGAAVRRAMGLPEPSNQPEEPSNA